MSYDEPDDTYYEESVEDVQSDASIPDSNDNVIQESSLNKQDDPLKTTDLCLIAGKRGSGKTNLLLFLIKQLTNLKINILIVDPVHDLSENLPNDPRIIHVPYDSRPKFDALLKELLKKKWQGMLVVDECDKFFPNRVKLTQLENYFIMIGRHHGIGMIAVTRRLSNLHTDLATQASRLFMFKHWNRNDLDYLRSSSLGEYASLLVGLERYHFLYLNPDLDIAQICTPVPLQK